MNPRRTYPAILLVSASALTFEIGLTRLFSLAQGYHFAFMVISIALLGVGAGGAVLMARGDAGRGCTAGLLSTLAALLSGAMVLSFALSNQVLFDPVRASWSRTEFLKILIQYFLLSAPFILSGMIVSAVIRSMSDRVHRIYLSDMAGAASGCVIIILILSVAGGEWAVAGGSIMALAASLVFALPKRPASALAPAAAVLLLLFAAFGPGWFLEVNISPYRDLPAALNFPGASLGGTIHSASGRLDIIEGPAVRAAPGISLEYRRPLPPQVGFTVNGGSLSTVTSPEGDLGFLKHLPSALAYRLRPGGEVFVVDAGGGMEVLSAVVHGSEVSGSETSSVVFDAMSGPLYGFSGGIYERAGVRVGGGREVLASTGRKFDVIQVPRTGTLGAASTGIRGLQEDFSLTTGAFVDYFESLRDGGFVSVSVYLLPPPRHELKLVSTAVEALEWAGAEEPGRMMMALRSWGVFVLLVKKGEVTGQEIEAFRGFAEEEGFDPVWYPGMTRDEANRRNRLPGPVYHDLAQRIIDPATRGPFLEEYLFDVRPATDERPFFGRTFKFSRMRETYESTGRKWGALIEGGYLLPWVLVQGAVAGAVLILAPLFLGRRERVPSRLLLGTVLYFGGVGLGFIFVEIALIQMLIPALGDPVYAVSTVLFTVLLATGTGSFLSGRFALVEKGGPSVILLVPALIVLYAFLLGEAGGAISGLGGARYALALFFLFPLGAAMGVPFPAGMRLLGRRRAGIIPWAWCVNGSFSVVGSVGVMMAAMAWGFTVVLVIAAASYLVASAALAILVRSP